MCGIAGYFATDGAVITEAAERAMRDAIRYRGRDAEGAWHDGNAHLFHSRLAIIDLEGGAQPMSSACGRFVIVFNGEIYNYPELRNEYERAGARFRTHSDTEVILEGFRLKGARVCEQLNGMFAFALWDKIEHKLFLARDRLGKKPLFWSRLDGLFCFASSLDAFRALPGWTGALNRSATLFYGLVGAFPEAASIYQQAQALPPATHTCIGPNDGEPRIERYWRPDFRFKSNTPLSRLLEEYEALLTDAIRMRLRSDVPVALTFSGGVDSGTIAALAKQALQAELACYTVDYHTAEHPSEETLNARAVASRLGLEWHYIHFDYHKDLLRELSVAYACYDQPCQQLALVYSHRLYSAIKPHATVVLSGNGADELFTGYDGDERIRPRGMALSVLGLLRPLFRRTSGSPYLRLPLYEAYVETLVAQARQAGARDEVLDGFRQAARTIGDEAHACGAHAALDLKMLTSLRYSSGDANFRLPDISGLMAQVEVRSPYLDHRMVEFAARLPHRYKAARLFSASGNKYLPKRYYASRVPREIAWSRKKGMGWNLRWDRSIAEDPNFRFAFRAAYDAVDNAGIDASPYRRAWHGYMSDVRNGARHSPHAKTMMSGFMLGSWLDRAVR